MGFEKMGFTPENGFMDLAAFPDPANEEEVREQLMRLCVQLRDYLNDTLLPAIEQGGAALAGVTPFPGVGADNVQAALEELQRHIDDINAGILPDFGVSTEKLANKAVTVAKLADEVVQKLNQVQPVTLGGTGSTNAQGARNALDVYARGQVIDAETSAALGLAADAEPKAAFGTVGKVVRVEDSEVMPQGLYKARTVDQLRLISEQHLTVHSTAETDDYVFWSIPGDTTIGTSVYRMRKDTLQVDTYTIPAGFMTSTKDRAQWVIFRGVGENLMYFECRWRDGSYSNPVYGILNFSTKKHISISSSFKYAGYDPQNRRMNFYDASSSRLMIHSYNEALNAISSSQVSAYTNVGASTAGQFVFARWQDNNSAYSFMLFDTINNSTTQISLPTQMGRPTIVRVAHATEKKVVLLYADFNTSKIGTAVFHLSTKTWDVFPSALTLVTGDGYYSPLGIDSNGMVYYLFTSKVITIGADDKIKAISLFSLRLMKSEDQGREDGIRLLYDTFALSASAYAKTNVKTGAQGDLRLEDTEMKSDSRHIPHCLHSEPWILDMIVGTARPDYSGMVCTLRDIPNLESQNIFNFLALGERVV